MTRLNHEKINNKQKGLLTEQATQRGIYDFYGSLIEEGKQYRKRNSTAPFRSVFRDLGYYDREYHGTDLDDIYISVNRVVYSTKYAWKVKRNDNTVVWIPKSLCNSSQSDRLLISGIAVRRFGLFPIEKKKIFIPKYILRKRIPK